MDKLQRTQELWLSAASTRGKEGAEERQQANSYELLALEAIANFYEAASPTDRERELALQEAQVWATLYTGRQGS